MDQSSIKACMLGGSSCASDNLLQSYSLGRAFCSERNLPEFYAKKIFASLPRYRAPMICSRGNSNYTSRCFLLSIPGDDFDAAVEQIELFRNQHPGGRIAIVADHYRLCELVSAFRAGAPMAISSTSWPAMYSSNRLNW